MGLKQGVVKKLHGGFILVSVAKKDKKIHIDFVSVYTQK